MNTDTGTNSNSSIAVTVNAKTSAQVNIENLQTAHQINNHYNHFIEELDLDELNIKLIAHYQHEEFEKIELPFSPHGSLMSLRDSFINIEIIDNDRQKENELQAGLDNQSSLRVINRPNSWEEIHATKNPIDWKDLFEKRNYLKKPENLNKILVLGRAGIGKSTFLKKLANAWSLKIFGGEFAWVFHIPLKEIPSYAANNLCEVIHQHWANHLYINKESWEIAWKKIIKQKVLFLFDGYDEISSQSARRKINSLLFEAERNGQYIISSRPYHLNDMPRMDAKIEVMGFTDKNILSFVDLYVKKHKQSLLEEIENNDNLNSIMHIPINAYLICMIWERWTHKNFTITDLYTYMLNYLLCIYKKNTTETIPDPKEVKKELSKELEYLYAIALKAMEDGCLVFSLDFNKITSMEVKNLLAMGLLKSTKSSEEVVELSEKNYYFIHLTFQEYLVAEYLAHLLISKNPIKVKQARAFIVTHKLDPRYSMIFIFLSGLIKKDVFALNIFFDILLEEPYSLLKMQEIKLLICCLESCEVSDFLLKKQHYLTYLSRLLKENFTDADFVNLFKNNYFIANQIHIVEDIIDFKKNDESRETNLQIMREIGGIIDQNQFFKIIVTVINYSLSQKDDRKSYDACMALKEFIENSIYKYKKTSFFFNGIFKKIGDNFFKEWIDDFLQIFTDEENPSILRKGALAALEALAIISGKVTFETFEAVFNALKDEDEDETIQICSRNFLDFVLDALDPHIFEHDLDGIMASCLKNILDTEEEEGPALRNIDGLIIGITAHKLNREIRSYLEIISNFIWDVNNPGSCRLRAVFALKEILKYCTEEVLQNFTHEIIVKLKKVPQTDKSTLEIVLNFFTFDEILKKSNLEGEVDYLLSLLENKDIQSRALGGLRNMINSLEIDLLKKIILRLKFLVSASKDNLIYADILHEISTSLSDAEHADEIASMIHSIIESHQPFPLDKKSLRAFQSLCASIKILYTRITASANQTLLKHLNQIMLVEKDNPLYESAMYAAAYIEIHLNNSYVGLSKIIQFLHQKMTTSRISYFELSKYETKDLLLFFCDNPLNVHYARKMTTQALVHKFHRDDIYVFIDDQNFIHFKEENNYRNLKLSQDEAYILKTEMQKYAKQRYGLVLFSARELSAQSRYILNVGPPLVLAFAAKILTRRELSHAVSGTKSSCCII